MTANSVIRKLMILSASIIFLSLTFAATPSFGLTVNHDAPAVGTYSEVSLFDKTSIARRAMQEDVLDTYYSFYCYAQNMIATKRSYIK